MQEENKLPKELRLVEKVSNAMDTSLRIPGTKFKFGMDPIIGLIPFAGEIATFSISAGLVMTMARHGASRKVVILMVINTLIDVILGSIPIIGNVFDFFYKSNTKNINLLKKYYAEGKYQGSGKGIVITIAVIFLLVFILLIYGLWKLTEYLYNYFF